MFQPEVAGPDLHRESGRELSHNPRTDREVAWILTRHPGLHIRSPGLFGQRRDQDRDVDIRPQ